MHTMMSWLLQAVAGCVLFLVAWLLSRPLHLKPGEAWNQMIRRKNWMRGLLHLVAMPALVMLLSWVTRGILGLLPPPVCTWMEHCQVHYDAWETFWSVILAERFIEGIAVSAYWARGKAFPIPSLILSILRIIIAILAAFFILKEVVGINIAPLLASTALVTAVIGFALQGVLGNLLGGMSLHLVRSLVPGDWIQVQDIEGEVIETNWRETRLRTLDGHIMIVPNSTVSSSVLNHMSWPNTVRRHFIDVGASYSDAPGDVIHELVESAKAVSDVLSDPPPHAFITEYKDFGINYRLRYWTRQYYNRRLLDGDVARMIWYRFKRKGIEIPFPMSDKLLNDFMAVVYRQRSEPPEDREVQRTAADLQASQFARLLMNEKDSEHLLTAENYTELARCVRRVNYTAGEVLFRQREEGDCCYVHVRGKLVGEVEQGTGDARHEFEIKPGALVGEMSLLTGLPRTATIRAVEECELLEFNADAFTRLLAMKTEIPERLAALAAERAASLKTELERMQEKQGLQQAGSLAKNKLLERFLRMLGPSRK